mmetsp:Transcript_21181/g.24170  ORF Transcript_21181/g.24170 Transcript_21181/m.24170 type:complete len:664 (+) Transcript_21181:137-2128(+)
MVIDGNSIISTVKSKRDVEASAILEHVLRENNVMMGGSSIGKGLETAAGEYLQNSFNENLSIIDHPDLNIEKPIVEDPFYIVDIGVVISQFYQWRSFFPRVEPFYAVKCNPDPLIIKTLAILGCNFDCASDTEIEIVQDVCADLPRTPEIIYANPCKPRKHLVEAIVRGVRMVTFDNVSEVSKCASISKKVQLVLRIVTDDRGSQCRLSSKYGAPRARWRNLLKAAKECGLPVVGVSFHVGSGCRDASRYDLALRDARELFDLAKAEFGFDMKILDIGGGFPGETHSFYNPKVMDTTASLDDKVNEQEGLDPNQNKIEDDSPYMFFTEIASQVAPMIDKLFPSDVRVIGEPGRYFVAAAATLITAIVGARSNEVDEKKLISEPISDNKASGHIDEMVGMEERYDTTRTRSVSFDAASHDAEVWGNITDELNDRAKHFAKQNYVTHETDAYNDGLDLYKEDFDTAIDLLGIPDEVQKLSMVRTVEGMNKTIAVGGEGDQGLISLAGAGEAAVNGIFLQAIADSDQLRDDFAYYVNDGVYGAFNNLMFDHATVRPRVLNTSELECFSSPESCEDDKSDKLLYASTVFGPTCDSIDVIARSVLLPKLQIGDWLYFQNMGAYTMAAASSFNGFTPTDKTYVCSIQPEYFASLIAGPKEEEKSDKDNV